jgi:tRNA pseudouridine38-40 synthase
MPNFKLEIEYDGTRYHGWQVQNRTKAKGGYGQGTRFNMSWTSIKKVLQEDIRLIVAGRTDSGVHALSQVANFKSSSTMAGKDALGPELPVAGGYKSNRVSRVSPEFNSRFAPSPSSTVIPSQP